MEHFLTEIIACNNVLTGFHIFQKGHTKSILKGDPKKKRKLKEGDK